MHDFALLKGKSRLFSVLSQELDDLSSKYDFGYVGSDLRGDLLVCYKTVYE